MLNTGKFFLATIVVLGFVLPRQLNAQTRIANSVLGSGAATSANANNRIVGTVGQAVIGQSNNVSHASHAGFWYQTADMITSVEAIQDDSVLPGTFRLDQNYPNPFNPTTTIQFAVPQQSQVTLKLFDLLGRQVVTLVDEGLKAGEYKVHFQAGELPSGIYFYVMTANSFTEAKKLTLLK